MKAVLNNYKQSPRKVRLVADFIRGKNVVAAEAELSFLTKRAALPFQKLLASAVANALVNGGIAKENLFVKEVRVDKGIVMKRVMPRAFGRASRINKRSSHLIIVLGDKAEKTDKKTKKAKTVKAEAKPEKKVTAKKAAPKKKVAKKEDK